MTRRLGVFTKQEMLCDFIALRQQLDLNARVREKKIGDHHIQELHRRMATRSSIHGTYDEASKIHGLEKPISKELGRFLYAITIKKKPSHIVETGVAYGVSTTYFLAALKRNGHGRLISIDKLDSVGMFVEESLKDRWIFLVGHTQDLLPTLNIDKLDIFLHDSSHKYNTMMTEFRWAYPKLCDGGILLSHDIGFCDAFFDFADEVDEPARFVRLGGRYAGAIVKGMERLIIKSTDVAEWLE